MSRRRRRVLCAWCQRQLEPPNAPSSVAFTRDHVMPRSLGGKRKVPCCIACNNLKADMTPDQWRAFRDDNPEWWKLWKGKRGHAKP